MIHWGCGPVHKPFTYHVGAPRSFPGGDNAAPQTAVQTADKGCTDVCIKSGAPSGQSLTTKPHAKTIGSPHNLRCQW